MSAPRLFGEGEIATYPRRTAAPQFSTEGFIMCPLPLRPQSGGWMEEVYRLAYEQAKACVLPPWHERNLFTCMN